jgi:hypothetical protein
MELEETEIAFTWPDWRSDPGTREGIGGVAECNVANELYACCMDFHVIMLCSVIRKYWPFSEKSTIELFIRTLYQI